MIQRIQTLYFLFTAVACIVCSCCDLARWVSPSGEVVARMSSIHIFVGDNVYFAPWLAILLFVALIMLVAVFIYHHRIHQARLCVLSLLLLIGGYVAYAIYAMVFAPEDAEFRPEPAAALPAIGGVFSWLAWHAVMKDELMVRSLDRLR